MSAPGSHSVDALPVHQLRDRNGYLDAVGSAGRTDDYLGTSLEDSVQMVPLDFDSDTSSPEGLKEDQRQLGSTPTFVSLDNEVEVAMPRAPPDKGKLYFLAICFLSFFAAFLPAQSLITTVFDTRGFWGLFTLYICFSISAFYATAVIKVLGVRKVFFVAACTNVFFIASCIPAYVYREKVGWIFFISCGLFGFIGAPLWVSQGIYLSRLTQHNPEVVGFFNGTFLGIFFTASIIGNTFTSIIGYAFSSLPIVPIFLCLLVVSVISAVLFYFIPEPPVPVVSDPPIRELFRSMWIMAKDKGILMMGPYYFYLGVACTFAWGVVPRLLPDRRLIGPVAGAYGAGTFAASFICGRIFDDYGWKPLATANFVMVIVGFLGVELAYKQSMTWIFFISSILFGAFEALANTLALSVLMRTWPTSSSTAFFYYRLLTGFGNAVGFLVGLVLPYNWEMFSLAVMCSITLLLLAFYLIFVGPAEKEAAKNQFTDNGA
jgi:MFS family permease